jgi:hypothetical protein
MKLRQRELCTHDYQFQRITLAFKLKLVVMCAQLQRELRRVLEGNIEASGHSKRDPDAQYMPKDSLANRMIWRLGSHATTPLKFYSKRCSRKTHANCAWSRAAYSHSRGCNQLLTQYSCCTSTWNSQQPDQGPAHLHVWLHKQICLLTTSLPHVHLRLPDCHLGIYSSTQLSTATACYANKAP